MGPEPSSVTTDAACSESRAEHEAGAASHGIAASRVRIVGPGFGTAPVGNLYAEVGDDDRLQIVQVPWDTSIDFAMPVSVWKEMVDSYYPFRGWIPVHRDTLDALQRLKARLGAPTLDAAVTELLARESFDE